MGDTPGKTWADFVRWVDRAVAKCDMPLHALEQVRTEHDAFLVTTLAAGWSADGYRTRRNEWLSSIGAEPDDVRTIDIPPNPGRALPKPDRVEAGQRWRYEPGVSVHSTYTDPSATVVLFNDGRSANAADLQTNKWSYLGTTIDVPPNPG